MPDSKDTEDCKELAPQWVHWIAENLLGGATLSEIKQELAKEKIPDNLVDHEIRGILQSPLFKLAQANAKQCKRAELVAKLQRTRASLLTIETRGSLPASVFHSHYRANNCPVLLEEFAKQWPAIEKWTFPWLKEQFGEQSITICDGRESDPLFDQHAARLTVETTFAALVDRIAQTESSNDFYAVARNRNLQTSLAPLWDDLAFPPGYLLSSHAQHSAALWIGPAGTITPLHHDTSDILFCQIRGSKRVRLIAPYELSVAEHASTLYGPDIESFPNTPDLAEVRIYDIEVSAGMTLFIPAGWWHHCQARTPSISLALNAFADNNLDWYRPGD